MKMKFDLLGTHAADQMAEIGQAIVNQPIAIMGNKATFQTPGAPLYAARFDGNGGQPECGFSLLTMPWNDGPEHAQNLQASDPLNVTRLGNGYRDTSHAPTLQADGPLDVMQLGTEKAEEALV